MAESINPEVKKTKFSHALVGGGCAGLSVDLVLFPLDTIKTRLQSAVGFRAAGGFKGVYAGVGSAATGSVPGAALFFCAYESVKSLLHDHGKNNPSRLPLIHMSAACCGEVTACLVRVPTEVVKQRAQTALHRSSSRQVFRDTLRSEGVSGLYRGYWSTVMREIPFSVIQFPLWENLKSRCSRWQGHACEPWQSSILGAMSGAVAAGITTPLDVAKTRIMLAESGTVEASGNIFKVLPIIFHQKGLTGLFAGVTPRVAWISLGGAIFLGIYDKVVLLQEKYSNLDNR